MDPMRLKAFYFEKKWVSPRVSPLQISLSVEVVDATCQDRRFEDHGATLLGRSKNRLPGVILRINSKELLNLWFRIP